MKKSSFIARLISGLLICTMLCGTAFAASEVDTAAAYLVEHGILAGDGNGNLNLDKGLTRAELAVILTRLDYLSTPGGLAEWDSWGKTYFSDPANRINTFTDLPAWAAPFIEYCYQRSLMVGVGDNRFDPQGKVNPQMASTVMLRYCAIPGADWDYQTSVSKAQEIGIAPTDGMDGTIVLRGTMAVMIYRGINYAGAGTTPSDPSEPTAPPSEPPAQDPTPLAPTMTIDEMKAEIVRLTNIERVKAGVPEVEILPELMDCAQAKAQDFIDSHYYDHTSPVYGTFAEMVKSYVPNAKSAAENIAPWRQTPQEVIDGVLDSAEHRSNMLEAKFTHIGVGIVEGADDGYWWVMQYVKLD